MTREEAIKLIEHISITFVPTDQYGDYDDPQPYEDALDMAIEALQNLSKPNNVLQGSDLISRQDALKPFCIAPDGTRIPEVDCDNFPVEFSVEFIKKHLLSLPSADAVEVVRCKDCKHWHREIRNGIEYFNFSSCDLNHYGDGHNFYCADAERRTDG